MTYGFRWDWFSADRQKEFLESGLQKLQVFSQRGVTIIRIGNQADGMTDSDRFLSKSVKKWLESVKNMKETRHKRRIWRVIYSG
jgi:hypothetical protein